MATCKDCLHLEACKQWYTALPDKYHDGCEHFKDRSRFVELPCKICDRVHRKDGMWDVVGFECDRSNSWRVKLERWKDQFVDYHESTKVVFKSFGITVFRTSEEVKAAIAERTMNAE